MRDLFTSIRKLSLAAIAGAVFGLMAFGQAAEAANFFEKNFWLSGPRYDGDLPPCEAGLDSVSNQFAEKENRRDQQKSFRARIEKRRSDHNRNLCG